MSDYDEIRRLWCKVADEFAALKVDNARLRALVKAAEFPSELDRCPHCGVPVGERHFECPGFTPDGVVR